MIKIYLQILSVRSVPIYSSCNKRVINSLEEESNEDPYAVIPTIGTIEINNVVNNNNVIKATREEKRIQMYLIF